MFQSEVKIREQYMQWKEVVKTERDLRLRIHILDFSLLRKITSSGFRWSLCIFKGYDNCLKWLNNNQIIPTSFYVNKILYDEYQINIKSICMKI